LTSRRTILVALVVCIAASFGPAAASARSTAPACATSGLVAWLDTTGSGTAGGTYFTLELTNLSGHACTLGGYPGVSAVDLAGRQLGSAAAKNAHVTPHVVSVAAGATARAVLKIGDTGHFSTSVCASTTAAGLRVYPPGRTASKVVPFPFAACSLLGPTYLTVEALT
jgi:uncharacterized protein DUF4232